MMFRYAMLLCLGIVSSSAMAQAKWDKEPSKIFGVTLGARVDTGPIVDCEKLYGPDATLERQPCYWTKDRKNLDTRIEIINLPFEDIYSGWINIEGGLVRSVSFDFKAMHFQKVLDIFQERFGRPTSLKTVNFANLAGAVLPTKIATWVGKRNSIVLAERLTTYDESFAEISNNALNRKVEALEEAKRKEAASKM